MKKLISYLFFAFAFMAQTEAQEVVSLKYNTASTTIDTSIEENISYSEDGDIIGISNVTTPSMSVYLPDPAIATGTAVVVLPGGALRFLSWENEGTKVANWLNSKGIAAFILKYRLDNTEMGMGSGSMPPMMMSLTVDEFDQLENANANPSSNPESLQVVNRAAEDAQEAIRVIRERASEWTINPDHIGYLGFSAGGGVALNAIIANRNQETMPNFIGSIYGPSLVDVVVPNPAPPLFIATAADHMNVAAGCLALFTTWKKAGGEAEMHLYGKGKGAFGMTKQGLPSDDWIEHFYGWLQAEDF